MLDRRGLYCPDGPHARALTGRCSLQTLLSGADCWERGIGGVASRHGRGERGTTGPRFALPHGTSTGGSVALQLAFDHPHLLRRMVLAAAACLFAPDGRRLQQELARPTERGDARGAAAFLLGAVAPRCSAIRPGVGLADGQRLQGRRPVRHARGRGLLRPRAPAVAREGTHTRAGRDRRPFYTAELFRRTVNPARTGGALPRQGHLFAAGSKVSAAIALGFLLDSTRHGQLDSTPAPPARSGVRHCSPRPSCQSHHTAARSRTG